MSHSSAGKNAATGRARVYVILILLVFTAVAQGDVVTPSGGEKAAAATEELSSGAPVISFQEASKELTSVFPIHMETFSDVVQQPYNWSGPLDASLKCDIGFTPSAIVIKGELTDDVPFIQTLKRPAMPAWWRIMYGADGVEYSIENPTSATQRLRFVLNFGSGALNPQVELLSSPISDKPAFIPSCRLEVRNASPVNAQSTRSEFQVAIPIVGIAESKFFTGPLRITAKLHDMDGGPSTYAMMQKVIERK